MTDCEKAEQFVCISCVEEVRYSFVSHLSGALRRKGINDVVVDVDSDNPLSKEFQEKIEKARVSVMVLPGDSEPTGVCLTNFVMVRDCERNKDQVLVPVLYGDSPLQDEWFSTLDLRGFSPIHQSRKECSDSKLVEEIARDVYEKLFYMERIGIYSKLLEIEKMVFKQPLDIFRVGIWGMPGIGKTTLAKAVFDQMSGDFDACCFIKDPEKVIHEKGLYRLLEEQFLKEMPGTGNTITKLSLLRDKLNSKRVLVVLDDVRNALVAESFLEGLEWWGPKILIIITSRDKQVFSLFRINQVYEVQGLNEKDALQLFLLCASIKDIDDQSLRELSMEVIKYADGNPLALSIYGRELKGPREPSEMMIAFLKLKQYPPFEIVDAIKGSYDTLSNSEKNIFLDIACFFQGENVDYAMQLFEGCGFFPHVGIDVLVEKCLVIISENQVRMHNLIQEFGREIINGDTAQIGWRSRLWEPWRIKFLLEDDGQKANGEHITTFKRGQVPEKIEGMFLDTSNLSFDIKPTAFLNMLNLRLLKIYCSNPEIHLINFSKGFLHSLPNELRLLHWENYPLQYLPQNFDPLHLVEINMPNSQLQKLWSGTKNLEMLRTIRLCHSQQLFDIDDLLNAQNLEVIDLQGCTRLQRFPAIGQLLHLRVVNLSGCTEIKILPAIPPNIEILHLQGTGILELPLSIGKPNYREFLNLLAEIPGLSGVSNLEQNDLRSLTSLMKMSSSIQDLGKLICLNLKDCSRLRSLPDMVNFELLRVLDLSGCSELETIQGFPRNLKELYLAGTAVREVPQLPQSLELFNAHGCASLKSIRLDFEKLPVHYTFSNCFDLSPQMANDFLMKALANAKHIPRERQQELNEAPAFSFYAPSHANQNSMLDLQPGSSVMSQLYPSWRNTLVGFAMLVEVAFLEDYCDATGFGISCLCRWSGKDGRFHTTERNLHCWAAGKAVPKVQKDHMFVFVDVNMRLSTAEGNDPNILADLVVFEFFPVDKQNNRLEDSCAVTRCGVRVITATTGNTSLENISPALSLDPRIYRTLCKEVWRVSYDGLQQMNKVLFLYIACLFNEKDVAFVAPLIASNINMDVRSGLKVLADRSLISVSFNGEIGMHCLLRQMAKEIFRKEFMLVSSSERYERLVDNSQSDVLKKKRKARAKNDEVVCKANPDSVNSPHNNKIKKTMKCRQKNTDSPGDEISAVHRLFNTCNEVFSNGPAGVIPSEDKIQKLREILDNMKPEDVGLTPTMPYFRPTVRPENWSSRPIKYLHLHECDQFSIGIFCLPPSGVIPLHNHPGMIAFSKLLFGTMHIKSYDWVIDAPMKDSKNRLAKLKVDSTFTAPCNTSFLYPEDGGNMHRFTAKTACAVLDVLGPPYCNLEGRHCTYFLDFPFEKFSSEDDVVLRSEEEKKGYAWLQERDDIPEDFNVVREIYRGPNSFLPGSSKKFERLVDNKRLTFRFQPSQTAESRGEVVPSDLWASRKYDKIKVLGSSYPRERSGKKLLASSIGRAPKPRLKRGQYRRIVESATLRKRKREEGFLSTNQSSCSTVTDALKKQEQ